MRLSNRIFVKECHSGGCILSVPLTTRPWRRNLGLQSHLKDWRSRGSNQQPLNGKTSTCPTAPRPVLRKIWSVVMFIHHWKMLACWIISCVVVDFYSFDLWFTRFPWWSINELENLHADLTTNYGFEPYQKLRARLGSRKTGLSPPPYFNMDRSKAVLLLWFHTVTCSCCPYLYFDSPIMWVTCLS